MDCVFCKIISGEFDASKVYEDDDILAFLDIHPVNPGQVLVIPKVHIDHFIDVPDKLADKIFEIGRILGRKIMTELKPHRVGFVINGYGVPHAHLIVVPLKDLGDITSAKMAEIENGKIVFKDSNLPVPSREKLDEIAGLLKL
ncbi:MAG: HIT family protein [Candidatus Falkowbacteria bacterium]